VGLVGEQNLRIGSWRRRGDGGGRRRGGGTTQERLDCRLSMQGGTVKGKHSDCGATSRRGAGFTLAPRWRDRARIAEWSGLVLRQPADLTVSWSRGEKRAPGADFTMAARAERSSKERGQGIVTGGRGPGPFGPRDGGSGRPYFTFVTVGGKWRVQRTEPCRDGFRPIGKGSAHRGSPHPAPPVCRARRETKITPRPSTRPATSVLVTSARAGSAVGVSPCRATRLARGRGEPRRRSTRPRGGGRSPRPLPFRRSGGRKLHGERRVGPKKLGPQRSPLPPSPNKKNAPFPGGLFSSRRGQECEPCDLGL